MSPDTLFPEERSPVGLLVYLLEILYGVFCRHQWIRERRANGRLGMVCMNCMKRKDHDMLRIVEWQPNYTPIEPAHPTEFPPPLVNSRKAA